MKSFLICSLIIFCLKDTKEIQKNYLIGAWQLNSPYLSDTYNSTFLFNEDGTFIYYYNDYDCFNPNYNVKGKFRISDDKLYLKILQFSKVEGYKIGIAEPSIELGLFTLDGGNLITVNVSDSTEQEPIFLSPGKDSLTFDDRISKCLMLNHEKYFKIYDDPKEFLNQIGEK